jgi:hypothetical protein
MDSRQSIRLSKALTKEAGGKSFEGENGGAAQDALVRTAGAGDDSRSGMTV